MRHGALVAEELFQDSISAYGEVRSLKYCSENIAVLLIQKQVTAKASLPAHPPPGTLKLTEMTTPRKKKHNRKREKQKIHKRRAHPPH